MKKYRGIKQPEDFTDFAYFPNQIELDSNNNEANIIPNTVKSASY